ncbi:hypothetical protein B7494_g5340 [Chlorociboria aeruginascens]|nr:hypothetical protein B7494_g5340 [Chlorociboria aeruginascens]
MPAGSGPKKQISQRRRLQNKQAQKNYRERQRTQLQHLRDIVGYNNGILLDPITNGQSHGAEPGTSDPSSLENATQDDHPTITIQSSSFSQGGLDPPGLHSPSIPLASVASNLQLVSTLSSQSHGAELIRQSECRQSLDPGQQYTESSVNSFLPAHDVIDHFLQGDNTANETLKRRILEAKVSLLDIMQAGLNALSKNDDSQVPQAKSSEKECTATPKLITDKIILLENSNQDPAKRLPDIHVNNISIKQFLFTAACVANAHALWPSIPITACDDQESPFFRESVSEEIAQMSCSRDFLHLKTHLRPCASQLIYTHHPYIDVLPFPTFRERVIKLACTESPIIDEDELCRDLENDGLICWGSTHNGTNEATGSGAPWDVRSWEAQPWFLKKWWILIGGAEGEIYKQTQWWCELRGDQSCYPCYTFLGVLIVRVNPHIERSQLLEEVKYNYYHHFSTRKTIKMEYVQLGKAGLKVSKVILGAMSFGKPTETPWSLPEEQALPILKHAFDMGINTWDTADVYSMGDSERIIGQALKKYKIPRERVVILSKCCAGLPDEAESLNEMELITKMTVNDGVMANRVGLSRKHIFDAVDASVARLGTYLDVLQIHRLDRETPREEIMRALNDVVASGKVRYIGASSMAAWEFQSLQNIAKQNGWHQFISMQDYHCLLYREGEREMVPYCRDTGVGLIPYSPLARGLVARPYNSDVTLRQKTDSYTELMIGKTTKADIEIIGRVEQLSRKKDVSMATIALAWCIKKGLAPIVGLSSIGRVNQAVEAVALVKAGGLAQEDIQFLEEVYVAKPLIPMF